MVRDRDSPIEVTGEAHLVSVTCATCDDNYQTPETNAHYNDENDIPNICSDCHGHIEDLWSDMYIRDQVRRLRIFADYVKAYGYYSKARQLREVARVMELYEPVIRGLMSARNDGAMSSRGSVYDRVQHYEEA